jgi:hypothetical protein
MVQPPEVVAGEPSRRDCRITPAVLSGGVKPSADLYRQIAGEHGMRLDAVRYIEVSTRR